VLPSRRRMGVSVSAVETVRPGCPTPEVSTLQQECPRHGGEAEGIHSVCGPCIG